MPFQSGRDRFFWDVRIPPPHRDAAAFLLEFECDEPGAIRAVTLHLQDGDHWLTASATALDKAGTLVFNRADFKPESGTPLWHKAEKLRLSFWQGAERPAVFHLRALRNEAPSTAIVRGGRNTAPGQSALAAQCAARAARLFQRAGQAATIVEDDFDALDFDQLRWIALPYNPELSRENVESLDTFVNRHNGRIAVFYNANRRLAGLMNVNLLPYSFQAHPWTTVEFEPGSIEGLPAAMPHFTRHLLPVDGKNETAFVTAYWRTRDGFRDVSLPAAAAAPQGLWFSHIPPLSTPSAVQWLAAQLAASDPGFRPQQERLAARMRQRDAQARQFGLGSPAVPNEIRAVWSRAIPARRREDLMRVLSERGLSVLFEHVATAGRVRERADGGLAEISDGRRARRFLNHSAEAAQRHDVEMHAWVILFNAEALPEGTRRKLRQEGRLMMDPAGESLPWLSPSHPDNRAMLKEKLRFLAAAGMDGIHLDYVRYPERQGCFSPASRRAFEKRIGEPVEHWPADVLPDGTRAQAYEDFRRREISSFLRETVAELRQVSPRLKISAAVYPTASAAAANGQDWPAWLRDELLDFICPMMYTQSQAVFSEHLASAAAEDAWRKRIVPGIGATADESQLDALSTAQQVRAVRDGRFGGVAFFQLDVELLDRILPVLSLSETATGSRN